MPARCSTQSSKVRHAALALGEIDTHVVDLGGPLTLPGLCDAHIHFYNWSVTRQEVELAATRSKAEMMARISERAATTPPGGAPCAWS